MSKAISGGQARSLIASFTVDTPWDEIPVDIQPFIELTPAERGERFAAFVRNGCRLIIGEPKVIPIDRTNPFNPAEFIGAGWSFWHGSADGNGLEGEPEQDSCSLAMSEVDLSKILLETHLKARETYTTGEERIKRIVGAKQIRVDLGVFKTLWDNKELIPLRFKEKTNRNTTFIFFDGQTLRSPGGRRYTLYFYLNDDGKWDWNIYRLDRNRRVNDPSAVLAS
jgi:hypothetical protein